MRENKRNADWGGRLQLRIRWSKWPWRREYGRMMYRTNCCGETLESWWEWENK